MVLGGEWGQLRHVLDGVQFHVPQGERRGSVGFVPIGLNGVVFNTNVFDSCTKS